MEGIMIDKLCDIASTWLERIAGVALVVVMVLTGTDVVGRIFKVPIPGTFEIVEFAGGLIIGLALPMSTIVKQQVRIDLVTDRLPRMIKLPLETITRLIGVAISLCIAYPLTRMANDLRLSGESSGVLHIPFYYVAYAMSAAFIVTAVVLAREAVEVWRVKK
jgi:TRAP-type C4-dicarboxylate transport system permease small subunit